MNPQDARRALAFISRFRSVFFHGGAAVFVIGILGYVVTGNKLWWIALIVGAFSVGMSWRR